MDSKENNKKEVNFRPPIVVILGHVDHGKTTILDYIRKSKVAEKESGGITQHIGAYQVTLPFEARSSRGQQAEGSHSETDEILRQAQNDFAINRKITFIDTPGHEAFSAMRSRGAKVADLAILVVAADEGIKPQTKEAILHIKKSELPMIVAINKVDKAGAQVEKVKNELAIAEVYLESIGGKVPAIEVSAKTGQGIDDLLETILLLSEVEGLGKIIDGQVVEGVVVESQLDPHLGASATLLVKNGILKLKDAISFDSVFGTIKQMFDFKSEIIKEALPSAPAVVSGLSQVPGVGERWVVCDSLDAAKKRTEEIAIKEKEKREPMDVLIIGDNQKVFNLIIKADVLGSLEAIRESLKIIPQEKIVLRIIKAEVGDIAESDIKLAESSKSIIFGFRIKKINPSFSYMAERAGIQIFVYNIIYDLIKDVREKASLLLEPEVIRHALGQAKVIAYFKEQAKQQIFGARVLSGKIENSVLADVLRNKEKIGFGKIIQLQKNKSNIKEGTEGEECGFLFEGNIKVEIGDILDVYREEKKYPEL